MKKIILALLISFTVLSADYVIKPDGTLTPTTTQDVTTPPPADTWVEKALPTKAFNVLDYGLKGDGVTDDSAALNTLAKNMDVTNWYFPAGKSFLLYNITPPPHVKFIWGGGTLKRKLVPQKYPRGIFHIYHTVVIDGLTIKNGSGTWEGNPGDESQGQIIISGNNPDEPEWTSDGLEIRNCHFDGTGVYADGISIHTGKTGKNKHKNMRIYNNTFFNAGHFGIEGGDRTYPQTVDMNSLPDLWVFNNTFTATEPNIMAMSIVRQRILSNTKIFNNIVDGLDWGLELQSCEGVEVFGNNFSNINENSYIEGHHTGNTQWGGYPLPVGDGNKVHDNWFGDRNGASTAKYGSYLFVYTGSNSEFYDNYIQSRVIVRSTSDHVDTRGGHWHHNTFVKNHTQGDRTIVLTIDADVSSIDFHDNKIYGTVSKMKGIDIRNASGASLANNNIYMAREGTCIVGDTQIDDNCDTSFVGTVPTDNYK